MCHVFSAVARRAAGPGLRFTFQGGSVKRSRLFHLGGNGKHGQKGIFSCLRGLYYKTAVDVPVSTAMGFSGAMPCVCTDKGVKAAGKGDNVSVYQYKEALPP